MESMVLWWFLYKAKSMIGHMHRESAEKGYKKLFLFGFRRFNQSHTHPSPKGNAKASFTWHVFLIQGPKCLPGSPFLLPTHQCGWGEGRCSSHRCPPAPAPIPVREEQFQPFFSQKAGSCMRFGTRTYTGGFTGRQVNTLSRGPRRKRMEETLRCPLSSSPKRCLQDPNFCSTLSSCDQPMKRYETTTDNNRYKTN